MASHLPQRGAAGLARCEDAESRTYLVRERTPVTEELVEWLEPPAAPGSQRGFRQ